MNLEDTYKDSYKNTENTEQENQEQSFEDEAKQRLKKHAWYSISNIVFTAEHYLTNFLDYVLGYDPDRRVEWISRSSSHFYASRWRPDYCFIYISVAEADSLDLSLRSNKIGSLFIDEHANFVTYTEAYISKLKNSPYDASILGKPVLIVKGPLEQFHAKVIDYDTEKGMYIVAVKLLVSTIQYHIHSSDFKLEDKLIDNTQTINN